LSDRKLAQLCTRTPRVRGISNFLENKFIHHRARARRACPGSTVYPPWIQIRRDVVTPLARWDHRKSKFGLCHANCNKAQLALLHDEVRILIFDDPAELEESQRTEFCFTQFDSTYVAFRFFKI
jgi:hypothetical protein